MVQARCCHIIKLLFSEFFSDRNRLRFVASMRTRGECESCLKSQGSTCVPIGYANANVNPNDLVNEKTVLISMKKASKGPSASTSGPSKATMYEGSTAGVQKKKESAPS